MSNITIAYTVSSSYSGSTLLSFLLNCQPGIGTISEFDARGDIQRNPDFMCSCGTPIRQCEFFTALERLVQADGIDFSVERLFEVLQVHGHPLVDRLLAGRLPYVRGPRPERVRDRIVPFLPGYRRLENRFFARNAAVIKAILELRNATVFADANKDPHRMLLLSRRFNVKPIYIFKNGIAGVYSLVKNSKQMGVPLGVGRATRRWFREQVGISHALARLNQPYLQLSYSDLCADVDGTLRRITDYLGVGFLAISDLASTDHHIVGNRMRLGDVSQIREDVSWQENFSSADKEEYRRVYAEYAPRLRSVNSSVLDHVWY